MIENLKIMLKRIAGNKYVKFALDWIGRNVVLFAAITAVLFYTSFSKFVLDTLAVGAAVVLVAAVLTGIVNYVLTRIKFLEMLPIFPMDSDAFAAAKVIHNAITKLIPVLMFMAVALAIAISVFIAQWRLPSAN